jgi:hypothetical protein
MRFVRALVVAALLVFASAGCRRPLPLPPIPQPEPINPVVPSGLRAVILWESSQPHSRQQLNVLNSTKLIAVLDARCGTDGWRKWDLSSIRDSGVANESAEWQRLWTLCLPVVERKLVPLPAVVVFGRTIAVTELPDTFEAAAELLK